MDCARGADRAGENAMNTADNLNVKPTSDDARTILRDALHQDVLSIEKFSSGLRHFVHDIVTKENERYVVRISDRNDQLAITGSVYWSNLLRPKNVPLPEIVYVGLDYKISPFQFVILERLPGTDLGHIYFTLSSSEKRALAAEVVGIQQKVGSLPRGGGFGHVYSYDLGFPFSNWQDFMLASLDRSRSRMTGTALPFLTFVDDIERLMPALEPYFKSVVPTPFLDDLTTKNVIVDRGRLSGIVDVDSVCFGDRLLTLGLTQAALLAEDYGTDYIRAWAELLKLDASQTQALRFYTALFCLDLMSEVGQKFNRERAADSTETRLPRLKKTLDMLVRKARSADH
jgi:aminoglycoside phosphotransferase (APT) family kinase protein